MKKSQKSKSYVDIFSSTAQHIAGLIERYFQGTISSAEQNALDAWIAEDASREALLKELTDPVWRDAMLRKMRSYDPADGLRTLQDEYGLVLQHKATKEKTRRLILRAAATLLIFLTAAFFIKTYLIPRETEHQNLTKTTSDVPPGGNRATLTLAGGRTILLVSAHQGLLSQQGTSKVVKVKEGELAYQSASEATQPLSYNTIATPRGGQYNVILPDGSKVFLNAASSLKYPTAFPKNKREVILTGEAYFEIAPNRQSPFYVQVGSMHVHVLGTSFNIMAYPDEPCMTTTLVTGAVRVLTKGQTQILSPGQQAELAKDGQLTLDSAINLKEVLAWKNGDFLFDNDSIESVMRKIARWYDVEVVYQGNIHQHFVANISRNEPLSKVLELLSLTKTVRFKVSDHEIVVMP